VQGLQQFFLVWKCLSHHSVTSNQFCRFGELAPALKPEEIDVEQVDRGMTMWNDAGENEEACT
jgi:hypothetical protein